MDVLVGAVGVLCCALVYLPVAVAIRLDSHGPVVFGQERIGKEQQTFQMYKFRTMFATNSGNKYKPVDNDERVTRVGRFLRRWSLDELPQFWNVLVGDMSLVGPRPELAFFVKDYQEWQFDRFLVKPGLTGWWQIHGRKQPMHAHIDEDIYYVTHCSFWLDLQILLRTFQAVVRGSGAR